MTCIDMVITHTVGQEIELYTIARMLCVLEGLI